MENIRSNPSEIHTPVVTPENELPPARPETGRLQKHFRQSLPTFSENPEFHRGSRSGGVGHALVAWSFMAALIDSIILFGVACFFVFSFSVLVKVQAVAAVGFFGPSMVNIGIAIATSLVGTYMVMLRVFLGFTFGEWICGLRLGSLKQRLNRFYSLKVLARVSLIFATGLIVLPILSLLIGIDLPGRLVRLPLVSLEKKK